MLISDYKIKNLEIWWDTISTSYYTFYVLLIGIDCQTFQIFKQRVPTVPPKPPKKVPDKTWAQHEFNSASRYHFGQLQSSVPSRRRFKCSEKKWELRTGRVDGYRSAKLANILWFLMRAVNLKFHTKCTFADSTQRCTLHMCLISWNAISNLFWSFRGDVGKVEPAVVRKGSLFRVGGSGGRWNGYPNQGHYPWFRSGWNFTRLFGCTSFTVFHLLGVISISSGNIQFEQQTEMYNKGWIFTSIGHRYLK